MGASALVSATIVRDCALAEHYAKRLRRKQELIDTLDATGIRTKVNSNSLSFEDRALVKHASTWFACEGPTSKRQWLGVHLRSNADRTKFHCSTHACLNVLLLRKCTITIGNRYISDALVFIGAWLHGP